MPPTQSTLNTTDFNCVFVHILRSLILSYMCTFSCSISRGTVPIWFPRNHHQRLSLRIPTGPACPPSREQQLRQPPSLTPPHIRFAGEVPNGRGWEASSYLLGSAPPGITQGVARSLKMGGGGSARRTQTFPKQWLSGLLAFVLSKSFTSLANSSPLATKLTKPKPQGT